MELSIRVGPGDWDAELKDVEAVARSVAASFAAYGDKPVAVLLEPTTGASDPPTVLSTAGPADEFVVRLNARERLWARLAFQFAHEFCHVLADPRTFTVDRFAWIEEALCETASLFALRRLASTWVEAPPDPNWRDYAAAFADYEAERVSDPARSVPPGETFTAWWRNGCPCWRRTRAGGTTRPSSPKSSCRFLEADVAWRAVRHLHVRPRSAVRSLAEFMRAWETACPAECRAVVEAISALILVSTEDCQEA